MILRCSIVSKTGMLATVMVASENESRFGESYSEASRREGIRTQERSARATCGIRRSDGWVIPGAHHENEEKERNRDRLTWCLRAARPPADSVCLIWALTFVSYSHDRRARQAKDGKHYSEASRREGIRTQERETLATFGLRRIDDWMVPRVHHEVKK
jgi:hypothetical protein